MMKNNKGYSLVEVMIVLAILAVVSGLATLTISMIASARATAAANQLNAEIGGLYTNTMSKSPELCLRVYKNSTDGCYYVERGVTDDGTVSTFYTPAKGTAKYDEYFNYEYSNKPINLNKRITIYYNGTEIPESDPAGGTSGSALDGILIQFNKSGGNVKHGAGEFKVTKEAGTRAYGTVCLNETTGGHYVK